MQIAPFDPSKKKKKKKPVAQELAEEDSVDTLAEKTENLSGIYLIHCFCQFLFSCKFTTLYSSTLI